MILLVAEGFERKCFLCAELIKAGSHRIEFSGWLGQEQHGDFSLHPECGSKLARMIERDFLEYSQGTAIADRWYRGQMNVDEETARELEKVLRKILGDD